MKTETKTLAIIDNPQGLTVFNIDLVDQMISEAKEHAANFVGDPTTAKGRAEIKSEAYKFSTSKTHLVEVGRKSIKEQETAVKLVKSELKRVSWAKG